MLHVSTETLDACIRAGKQHHQAGEYPAAIAVFQRALAIAPAHPVLHHYIALSHANMGNLEEALAALRRSLAAEPRQVQATRDLGRMLREVGLFDDSAAAFQKAAEFSPHDAEIYDELGISLCLTGRHKEALAAFLTATRLSGRAAYQNDLALVYQALSRTDEAVAACVEAIHRQPDYAGPYSNLGSLRLLRAEYAEAFDAFREALRLAPGPGVHSNIIFALHHAPGAEAADQLREARRWAAAYARTMPRELPPLSTHRTAKSVLRVGFVSGDLREHPVGRFMASWTGHVDKERLHLTCYSTGPSDARSREIQGQCDRWRPVLGRLRDAGLAQIIRNDGIDVLFDLAVHTHGARLLAFAERAAPVQVTWLGYCGTTGLDEMDFRLSNAHFDPPGETEAFYSEKTVRLPAVYWCYAPPAEAPAIRERPPGKEVVFGSLNNFSKVSRPALETWAAIMARVAGSQMMIHCLLGSHREAALRIFEAAGVERGRVSFFPMLPMGQFLEQLQEVDIALDSFPFAGGMTTCDTLWMGVPVVTLRGTTAVGRGGASILANIGLPELVATTREAYIEKAAGLAGDEARRRELRRTMRERMTGSPLMDAPRFARDFEAAVRGMWEAGGAGGSSAVANYFAK